MPKHRGREHDVADITNYLQVKLTSDTVRSICNMPLEN